MSKEKQLEHKSLQGECLTAAKQLHNQVRDGPIPIFDAQFSNAKAFFAFDKATTDVAFTEDAFVSQRMNRGSGGSQRMTQKGLYGHVTAQSMVLTTDHPLTR